MKKFKNRNIFTYSTSTSYCLTGTYITKLYLFRNNHLHPPYLLRTCSDQNPSSWKGDGR